MKQWIYYILMAFLGISCAPRIDAKVFHIGTDGGMMLCFGLGILITTISFALLRWKKFQFAFKTSVVCFTGAMAFTPGYLIAWAISVMHLF